MPQVLAMPRRLPLGSPAAHAPGAARAHRIPILAAALGLALAAGFAPAAAQRSVVLLPGSAGDAPRISADGRVAAYTDFSGVFVIRTDGSGMKKITSLGWSPSLSEDGRYLAVGTIDLADNYLVRVFDTETLDFVEIGTNLP